MMPLSGIAENDLILLESYLDDELSSLETEALRQRLANDAALSAALADLRSQRELRRQVFAGFEPSEASVENVIARVGSKVDSQMIWAERARSLRFVSGVAAMLLLGF